MVKLIRKGVYYMENRIVKEAQAFMTSDKKAKAEKNTLTYGVLKAHNTGRGDALKLRFDALISTDASYVDVIQTARACGMTEFPVPYTLINQNSGKDLHAYGLSAAKKYGGDYVPAHLAEASEYARECVAKSGEMLLSSDAVRCGTLGCMAVGSREALVRHLLGQAYDVQHPETVVVYLRGKPRRGVGAHDVALALIKATSCGFAANKILEFIGNGAKNVGMDFRNHVDAMMVKTGCFSTVWETDEKTAEYFLAHGRAGDYKPMAAVQPAYYDGAIVVDLSRVEPMIASKTGIYTIREVLSNPELLPEVQVRDGKAYLDGVSFAGLYEDVAAAAEIVRGKSVGDFSLTVYPASKPVYAASRRAKYLASLTEAGAKFGEPCEDLSSALSMDARSAAATAVNGGALTSALDLEYVRRVKKYKYNAKTYESRVYHGIKNPDGAAHLVYGDKIADLPALPALGKDLCFKVASVLDALSAEEIVSASSPYRYHPEKLAETALADRDADYVACARELCAPEGVPEDATLGSALVAGKLGGGACERAVCCQRVLGGVANIAKEYSAEYRTSLINWGILPLTAAKIAFKAGDYVFIEDVLGAIKRGDERVIAKVISRNKKRDIVLTLGSFSEEERKILLAGSVINYIKEKRR